MPKINSLIIIFFIVFVFACKSKKDAANMNVINVEKGHIFEVELKSNPSTGYSWMLAEKLDSTLVEFDKKDFISDGDPTKPMMGTGGTEIWTFTGVDKGKTIIKMKYARSWEDSLVLKNKSYLIKIK